MHLKTWNLAEGSEPVPYVGEMEEHEHVALGCRYFWGSSSVFLAAYFKSLETMLLSFFYKGRHSELNVVFLISRCAD